MSISNNKTFYSYLFIYSWLMPVYKLYCWAAHSIPSKDPKEEGYRSGLAHHETQDAWGFEKRLVCSNNSSRAALHCFSKIQTWASGLDIDDCYQSGPPPCRLSVGAGSPRKSGWLGLRKAYGVQQQLISRPGALFFKNTNMGFGPRYIDDCYQGGPPPCRLSVGAGLPRKSGCLRGTLQKACGWWLNHLYWNRMAYLWVCFGPPRTTGTAQ